MGISDYLETLKKHSGQRVTIKVCMMGPRAVGKTSILTAIFNETSGSIASTKLKLVAKGDTEVELLDKKRELENIFRKRISISDRPDAGIAASSTVHTFGFSFGIKGKDTRIDLEVKDFPGEYVENNPQEVISYIKESNAIMIAIDSPHVMEENGKYAELKNKVETISSFFKSVMPEIVDDKLVMLVPLKCEKYLYEGRINDLKENVKSLYSDIITHFITNDKIACVITPIFTLGGVVFDCFDYSPKDEWHSSEPVIAKYNFYEEKPLYEPRFCVQPLYYLLSFAVAQYEKNKNNLSLINKIMAAIFNVFAKDPELYDEVIKMETFRCVDIEGYEIITGKNKFHYNR